VNRCRTSGWTLSLCALTLALGVTQISGYAQTTQQPAHPEVPDAPTPQTPKPLSDIEVTPGIGSQAPQSATPTSPNASPNASSGAVPADTQPASTPPPQAPDTVQTTPPEIPEAGKGPESVSTVIRSYTNAVEVPVTVKDSKGKLVAGLTYRDFRVFENNQQQQIRYFTVDPFPLSIAFVIDQSVTQDVMARVNDSLGAIQGALTPYDDVAVFAYNNGPKEITDFTGAQSNRLTAILALNKAIGREEVVPVTGGPLAGCSITSNGGCVDPNLQQGRSAGSDAGMTLPKEIHTLNDAILRAAVALSTRPNGRRRVIYVVSDGKEYGSKASSREVIKYLQGHKIAVYATLVGDSARWGEGYLSRFHIPFQMNDNVLPKYTQATGGSLDAERSLNGIERSYQKIAEEARNQYTIVYYSHQPFIDGRYRSIDVRVDRPSKEVEVTAKPGYIPTAQDAR
jgi:VWFA-related protein